MCVDVHNIVCILCVCNFFFFLILRIIHIKHWYWCLIHEVNSNNFVVIYSMCKYTVWYVYILLLQVVTTVYM